MTEEQYAAKQRRPKTPARDAPAPAKPSKHQNIRTNGYHSKKEAKRAEELKLLVAGGLIRDLREQVRFVIIPKQEGERECAYVADFVYYEVGPCGVTLAEVVEDCKGFRDAQYKIKRKLMLHVHGIRIRET